MKYLVVILIIVLLACSCNNKRTLAISNGDLELDSFGIDTTFVLTSDMQSPRCKISLHVKYVRGKNADKINRAIINSGILISDYILDNPKQIDVPMAVQTFANQYLADYKKEYGNLYLEDRQNTNSYNCSYILKTEVSIPKGDIMAYMSTLYIYGGGEHGIHQTLIKNFDLKTGDVIKLKDLFITGYEATLKDIIVAHLQQKFKTSNFDELKKKYIFANDYIYIPENFIIDDDAITFIYCEDEISPHNVGEIRIKIDKDEINKLLK